MGDRTIKHEEAGAAGLPSCAPREPSMRYRDLWRMAALNGGLSVVTTIRHDRTSHGSVVSAGILRHHVLDASVGASAAGGAVADERRAAVLFTSERA
jgi:hypothetical protein